MNLSFVLVCVNELFFSNFQLLLCHLLA